MAVAAAKVAPMAHILNMKSKMPRALFHLEASGCLTVFLVVTATRGGGVPFEDLELVIAIGISPLSLVE